MTSGGIEALELIGKSFLDPGDPVAVEAPTYLRGIMAFRCFEAEVLGVPMDGDGLRVGELADLLAERRPKLLYTFPDHQNPAGVSLSLQRRAELVEVARRYGVLVVDDVAYRELAFDTERLPSLWSMGPRRPGWPTSPAPFFQPDGRGPNRLRLSFRRVDDDRIEEGIRRLATLFRDARDP